MLSRKAKETSSKQKELNSWPLRSPNPPLHQLKRNRWVTSRPRSRLTPKLGRNLPPPRPTPPNLTLAPPRNNLPSTPVWKNPQITPCLSLHQNPPKVRGRTIASRGLSNQLVSSSPTWWEYYFKKKNLPKTLTERMTRAATRTTMKIRVMRKGIMILMSPNMRIRSSPYCPGQSGTQKSKKMFKTLLQRTIKNLSNTRKQNRNWKETRNSSSESKERRWKRTASSKYLGHIRWVSAMSKNMPGGWIRLSWRRSLPNLRKSEKQRKSNKN